MKRTIVKSNFSQKSISVKYAHILYITIILITFATNSEGQSSALSLAEKQLQYIEQASDSDLLQENDFTRPYLSNGAREKAPERILNSNKFITLNFEKIPRTHLRKLRVRAYKIYSDMKNSLARRQAAFEFLCDTMVTGTDKSVIDKYLKWDTMSRITENAEIYSLHLLSPDGTHAWLTIANGKVIHP